ncbi:MAG: helix-turn-helix domain-containing protein [Pseudonocardiaceae bacterium]|nr:helix-turn-helix domain-containing protein [Pseudonocardiaceae bacterium]
MLAAARKAAGHTQESLAGALYMDRKTVIRWEAGDSAPWPYLWPKLARLLGVTPERLQALFEAGAERTEPVSPDSLDAACDWLDRRACWSPGTSRRKMAARIARLNARGLYERQTRRARIGRSQVVRALTDYYGDSESGFSLYGGELLGHRTATTILTCSEWLDLRCPLTPDDGDHLMTVVKPSSYDAPKLDSALARAAIERLAEASVLDVRLMPAQLYRLLDIDAQAGKLSKTVDLVSFAEYALTADLLEGELLDTISNGTVAQQGILLLRDRYLPDLASVVDLPDRACVGGVLALCAIARPADAHRPTPDYALLVQKRSDQVLNAPGRLAVIPKGFHRPLADHRADAHIAATLRRELEEELFGRADLDNTLGESRAADPMHHTRLSEPMRWLTESDALRMECTGFGLNLVSGNYEFACMILIEDEEFWRRYGGHIEANWETTGLRPYSSMDRSALTDLAADESWSNEGLFALLQGLRRLGQLGDKRINLPLTETTVRPLEREVQLDQRA